MLLMLSTTLLATPRLTVVVVVDGMSESSLAMLRPYWSQGGLRTLSEESFQTAVSFDHLVFGGDETTVTLMTGTSPQEHGYAMDTYYSRTDRRAHDLLEDDTYHGIGTSRTLSARAIQALTITDDFRLRYGAQAKIYAIGIHPTTTIALAGHAANACCWLDATQQRWATTSFYQEGLPSVADQMNVSGRFAEIAARQWTPRLDINMYTHPTDAERKRPFSYLSSSVLTESPAANSLVIELALALQRDTRLGEDNTPDCLMLELTTLSPNAKSDNIASAEHEDMYLWLNQDLGYLMEQLNKRIGKNNYQLLVIGRPTLGMDKECLTRLGMPARQFNIDRAAALTGTYLMAIYGHERWVDGGYGHSVFLNRTLIEQKRLSLETIQRQVANFLMEFEGVQLAYPQSEAIMNSRLLPSLSKRTTGDVVFTLAPGWQLMATDTKVIDHVIDAQPTAPIMFWSGSFRNWPTDHIHATDVKSLILE